MDLYLITPPQATPDELTLVRHFLERGLHRLHIRKPSYSEADFRQYIMSISPAFHANLVLHSAFGLASEFPSIGIHLRSSDRQNAALVQALQQTGPASLSASFHAWEEIIEQGAPYDYVFISPVFDSISKQGYRAAIDLAGNGRLKQWGARHKKKLPRIVALGGVNAHTLPAVREHGFDGAAILGAVWESANPGAAFDAIIQANDNPGGS